MREQGMTVHKLRQRKLNVNIEDACKMNVKVRWLLAAACLIATFSTRSVNAQTAISDSLVQQTTALIDESAGKTIDAVKSEELFRAAILDRGNSKPLLDWLADSHSDLSQPSDRAAAELEVHIASRRGDLQRAVDVITTLMEQKDIAEERTDLQIWQAKLFDALGDVDKAKGVYESLAKKDLSENDQQSIRLRLALMGLIGNASPRATGDAKPLIELAKKSKDISFRNRAANVLAVQNQHSKAIELFTIQGEGTMRFRSASRVAEWAIRAKKREKAIKTAWDAVNSAELKRDRNYALALLVEAYRLEKAKAGLKELVKEFKKLNKEKKAMNAEMQAVWISLLRELGQTDEAIALFKSTAGDDSGFTVELRRELLEMEGEAGQEERMIQSYRKLIASEPNELTWRSGLTQILLENGKDDDAKALWTDYVQTLERGSQLLISAQTLGEFGMDDLAHATIERMVTLRKDHGQALLYWADLQQRRGNIDDAEQTLNRVLALDDVGEDVRAELASSFERIGRQDKAIEVIESIRKRLNTIAEDMEMRLAWLYSEIGDEDKALEQWLALWNKINSIPRRRYVEDRMMTVASRLGTLADIAIDLEEKLDNGTANDREAGLLVRIYSRVNDSVAATEISEMYMAKSGKNQIEQLKEKGRIYQICNDYWNYEKVIERLIAVDPEGETEYLRQLALSMLERGKSQEARAVLMTLRNADDGKDSIGGEFEAGVLSLVGMNAEAADAYRKGIATHPDRIESYLLLANLLRDMRQTDRAVGMFQFLAENAKRDDLFTIAIDGLLNMEADAKVMQWARRITLERLAGREDKNYLYQLLADLSAEVNDKSGQIRAMENSLAVSGTRRLSVLRECMDLSSRIRGGAYYSSSSRGPSNKGNTLFFAFGRRLIGLGELMPPQVFLDLGQAFLSDGDTGSAERTFAMARNLADPRGYQREVASIFEKGDKIPESLTRYEKLLRTSPSDVALIARVAKLNEKEGKDDIAFRFYQRGLNLLLLQTPLTTQEESKQVQYWAANRDAYQMYSEQLLSGILVTMPADQIAGFFKDNKDRLSENLMALAEAKSAGRSAKQLTDSPRIQKHSEILRRFYFAFDRIEELEAMDISLLSAFPDDKTLIAAFSRERISKGRYDSVRRMLEQAKPNDQQRQQMLVMLGDAKTESEIDKLSPKEMWARLLPVWMKGDNVAARKILRRVDATKGRAPGARPNYVVVNGIAVLENQGTASDVGAWMRLAKFFGDDGLALQFARSRLSDQYYGSAGIVKLFDTYRSILPEEPYGDLVRFAANLYKDDKNRLADYLWLVTKKSKYLGDAIPDGDKILELVEDSNLTINYNYPFGFAFDTFPVSIRSEAIAALLSKVDKKQRPRELIAVAFTYGEPIDEATQKVVLEYFEGGIEAAIQDDYLRYCTYSLPRNGIAIRCAANKDLAIQMLDLLMVDKVHKRNPAVARMAEFIKAVVLHQAGATDDAVQLILKSYGSDENLTDYYARNAQTWAYNEIVPSAVDSFLAVLDKKVKNGKPTIAQTNQRLTLIKQGGDESTIRASYLQALKDHPSSTQIASGYERWEQRAKRTQFVIELRERQLKLAQKEAARKKAAAKKAAAEKAAAEKADNKAAKPETSQPTPPDPKVVAAQNKLAQLWFSVNHRAKGMKYWVIQDDLNKQRFAEQESKRADLKNKKPAVQAKPSAKKKESENAKDKKAKKKYAKGIPGVKKAIADKEMDSAQKVLRELWRTLPPAKTSPYGYRNSMRSMNNLYWPDETKQAAKESSADEKKEAKRRAREIARGGLATFAPRKAAAAKKRTNAWQELAKHSFAIDEMKRIMRSQPTTNLATVKEVSLGLLRHERLTIGDDQVFSGLVDKVRSGHISDEVLMQLFEMLNENHERINDENISIIDVLLDRLDLTDARRASQLADLCAKVGQADRSKSLYRHCALLESRGNVGLASLINKAKENFQGDELMELAESMFVLTNQSKFDISAMLTLRLELLTASEAAERSKSMFAGEVAGSRVVDLSYLINAVTLFSKAGDDVMSVKCLAAVLQQHGKPKRTANSNQYNTRLTARNRHTVSRANLIQMFPKLDADASEEAKAAHASWLTTAAKTIAELKEIDAKVIAESLLTIAIRQCELDDKEAAKSTLDNISSEMLESAPGLELLAIDVFRTAGDTARALEMEQTLFDQNRLTHLRFGDLLRDTASEHGTETAAARFDELVKWSADADLLKAAQELSADNENWNERVMKVVAENEAAESEYSDRQEASKLRAEKRKQWAEIDKEARLEKSAKADKENARKKNAALVKP